MTTQERVAKNFLVLDRVKKPLYELEEARAKAIKILEGGDSSQVYIYQLVESKFRKEIVSVHDAEVADKAPSLDEIDRHDAVEGLEDPIEDEEQRFDQINPDRGEQPLGEFFNPGLHRRRLFLDPGVGQEEGDRQANEIRMENERENEAIRIAQRRGLRDAPANFVMPPRRR